MLKGKTVLVTGGTGAIGAAICQAVASHGADVAFTYLKNETRAIELRAEIDKLGRRSLAVRADVRSAETVGAAVEQVETALSRIDVLVNNAGLIHVLPFALIEEQDWDEMMAVNLKGMFLFAKAVVRGMIRRRAGAIVNMGSIAGQRMVEVPVHYATAKAGVIGFTTALAKELCRYQIRVNAVVPGLIEGGIGDNISERQMSEYKKFCALGRAGKPEEVANLVAFLASDSASYINAQAVVVDGGL